jgi:hypothetical protein
LRGFRAALNPGVICCVCLKYSFKGICEFAWRFSCLIAFCRQAGHLSKVQTGETVEESGVAGFVSAEKSAKRMPSSEGGSVRWRVRIFDQKKVKKFMSRPSRASGSGCWQWQTGARFRTCSTRLASGIRGASALFFAKRGSYRARKRLFGVPVRYSVSVQVLPQLHLAFWGAARFWKRGLNQRPRESS